MAKFVDKMNNDVADVDDDVDYDVDVDNANDVDHDDNDEMGDKSETVLCGRIMVSH